MAGTPNNWGYVDLYIRRMDKLDHPAAEGVRLWYLELEKPMQMMVCQIMIAMVQEVEYRKRRNGITGIGVVGMLELFGAAVAKKEGWRK